MPCNYPGIGRQTPDGKITYYGHIQIGSGKLPPLPPSSKQFPLPCGKCTGCKLERSRQWAVRLMHEAQLHERTSFITLTYRDECLPQPARASSQSLTARAAPSPDDDQRTSYSPRTYETHTHEEKSTTASLSKGDLRGFTKRLNEHARRKFGKGVKYYACGEYGDRTQRPHYHIAVYGEDFSDDRQKWKRSNGNQLWRSSRLHELWPHGDADIGELTFESAAYIARYIMKKITGVKAAEHYRRTDERGEEYWLVPEFNVMSRRPGLAKEWFDQHGNDVYPHDTVIVRGHPSKPPRYYDKLLEALKPYEYEALRAQREQAAKQNAGNNTPARLEAREAIALAKLSQKSRPLE